MSKFQKQLFYLFLAISYANMWLAFYVVDKLDGKEWYAPPLSLTMLGAITLPGGLAFMVSQNLIFKRKTP